MTIGRGQGRGIDIPVLCHDERYDPVGVCRMCVVDSGRAPSPPLVRPCEDGMEVKTSTPDVERSRATLTGLLLADQPPAERDPNRPPPATTRCSRSPSATASAREAPAAARLRPRQRDVQPGHRRRPRRLHPLRPLRPRLQRHPGQRRDRPQRQGLRHPDRVRPRTTRWAQSSCVTCGECVAACPTGALTNKPIRNIPIRPRSELDAVDSVCPYCGVGCALTYHVDRERGAIAFAEGRDQPGSQEPAVRQGAVRLGLRGLAAAADRAADPP